MSKHLLLLFAILLLGALFRFIWLDKVPHSVNGDQLHYLISAKAFVLSGKDITQAVTPLDILLFHYPPAEVVQAELPYFLDMLTVGLFPFSLTANALPNATLSLLIVVFLYLIAKKLINEQFALATAFIAAINPWFIAMGRTSYETIPATFFFLCSFYILLITKGWRILWAIPIFLLAFYSYIATKLIFLPLVIVFCVYCYFFVNKKHFLRQYLVVVLSAILIVGFYFFQITNSTQSGRLSEILRPSSESISNQVDVARKTSIKNPLLYVFENKISVFSKTLTVNVFESISPKYLFMYGDYFFLLGKHGFFYPIEFVFLLLGFIYLARKNRALISLLIVVIAISILPQIVHTTSISTGNFSPHIALLMPFFIFFIAAGIWQTISIIKKREKIITSVILALYIFFIGNFANIYFFQMPLQHNFFNFPDRVAAHFAELAKNNQDKIAVYAHDPRGRFQQYLFYTNSLNKDTIKEVTEGLKNKKYTLNNVTFLSCDSGIKNIDDDVTAISHTLCDMNISGDRHSVVELSDSNRVYQITNDKLCKGKDLKPFLSDLKVSDFDLKKLSNQQFCHTFITVL